MKQTAVNNNFIVYVHINNANGKKYFGITCKSPNKRWGRNGIHYNKNPHFWNAIQKYGWDNFSHEVILDGVSLKDACAVESHMIKSYMTNNPNFGYNNTSGGETGQIFSEESKARMRESSKSRVYTDEWKQHLSDAGKGRKPWNYGKHLSNEHKEKVRLAGIGRKHSDESIEKMRKNSSKNRAVEIDGILFPSIIRCCEYLGDAKKSKQMQAWLCGENSMPYEYMQRGLTYHGINHEYVEDSSKTSDKIVVCDGIEFPSMAACERYYELPRLTVTRWINGKARIPDEFINKGLRLSEHKRYWYKII